MIWLLVCKVAELPDPKGPFPKPADSEIGDFYVRFGMAIAAWQFVEANLFNVYQMAFQPAHLPPSSRNALNAAFHAPAGFRVRLDMTNAALKQLNLLPAAQAEWDSLYTRCVKRSKRRNSLAHATVAFQPYERAPGKQLFLTPNLMAVDNDSTAFDQGNMIGQKELDDMIASFSELSTALNLFMVRLHEELPGASLEQLG